MHQYFALLVLAAVALSSVDAKRSSASREIQNQAAKARRSQGVLAFYRMQTFFFRVTLSVSAKTEFKQLKTSIVIQRKTFLITKTRALEGEGGEVMAAATMVILELKTEIKVKELRSPTSDVTKERLANCSDTLANTSDTLASIDFATEITMTTQVEARFKRLQAKGKCMSLVSLQTSITVTLTISSSVATGFATGQSITTIITVIEEYMLIIVEVTSSLKGSGSGSSGSSGSSSGSDSGEAGYLLVIGDISATVLWSAAGVDCDASCVAVDEVCNFTHFAEVFNDTANVESLLSELETPNLDVCLGDSGNSTNAAPSQNLSDGSCNLGLDAEPACTAADLSADVSRLCFCTAGAGSSSGSSEGDSKK